MSSSSASPSLAPAPLLAPPLSSRDELGPVGRNALIGGVVVAHVLGGWALLQVQAVREAIAQVAPVLMVDMIVPAPPKPAPPPPPSPQPRVIAPAPPPLIAAAATPSPTPPSFVIAEPPPPAPPTPLVAPPAPPAPPAMAPAAPEPIHVAASSVRYKVQPRLNFPLLSQRAGESGEVVLRIVVDVDGRLKEARIHRSSGFDRIDQAALQDIRSASFFPRTVDGKPVEWQALTKLGYDR